MTKKQNMIAIYFMLAAAVSITLTSVWVGYYKNLGESLLMVGLLMFGAKVLHHET